MQKDKHINHGGYKYIIKAKFNKKFCSYEPKCDQQKRSQQKRKEERPFSKRTEFYFSHQINVFNEEQWFLSAE